MENSKLISKKITSKMDNFTFVLTKFQSIQPILISYYGQFDKVTIYFSIQKYYTQKQTKIIRIKTHHKKHRRYRGAQPVNITI